MSTRHQSTAASFRERAARSTIVLAELPDERLYDRSIDQALDTALLAAIEAADAAGNTTLATVFRLELGSHYFDCQWHIDET